MDKYLARRFELAYWLKSGKLGDGEAEVEDERNEETLGWHKILHSRTNSRASIQRDFFHLPGESKPPYGKNDE